MPGMIHKQAEKGEFLGSKRNLFPILKYGLRIHMQGKDVYKRQDVFSMDEEKAVYNTEMQQKRRADLAKRSRYYQSLVDAGLLEPGVPDYNRLNTSYIIMIMPFDLFGHKKYVYTFRARCEEEPECLLEDGATRIFLNTRGENDDEVPRELAEFLHYLEETTDERAASCLLYTS